MKKLKKKIEDIKKKEDKIKKEKEEFDILIGGYKKFNKENKDMIKKMEDPSMICNIIKAMKSENKELKEYDEEVKKLVKDHSKLVDLFEKGEENDEIKK